MATTYRNLTEGSSHSTKLVIHNWTTDLSHRRNTNEVVNTVFKQKFGVSAPSRVY